MNGRSMKDSEVDTRAVELPMEILNASVILEETTSDVAERYVGNTRSTGETAGNYMKEGEEWDWKFWTIIGSLCITSLLTAIEATVTSTALPSISNTLRSREVYVWFVNAIFLSR